MDIKIYKNPVTDFLELYFFDDRNGERYLAQPVKLEFKKSIRGDSCKPTLTINGCFTEEFLNALAEELDKKGIKTDKDAKIAGTLDATRYHLEDLRKLLKL